MRVGLIARADDRGLGTLTQSFHHHFQPDRTLIVLTGHAQFPDHPDRFTCGDLYEVEIDRPSVGVIKDFLNGLDVVYSAETFYDWRIIKWANQYGVKTVLHGMPELTRHHRERLPEPDAWWWPTEWMLDSGIPEGRVVPIPVPETNRTAADPHIGPLKVLHPGGKLAVGDREGTEIFLEALEHTTNRIHVTLAAQDRDFDLDLPPNVSVTQPGYVKSRWDLYAGQHVTVMPRRYGGLSLKVHESLACGVPVVLPDISPNRRWPGPRVAALPGSRIRVPYGVLPTWDANPHAVAELLDDFAENRDQLACAQAASLEWAAANTWDQLLPVYQEEFEEVCS